MACITPAWSSGKLGLNTFDLGGCMKALPLIWNTPQQYTKHVVIPGPFHTGMNYIGMVTGNKCRGSGYSDIFIKGKAYAKALFRLRTVTEAMERLLLDRFLEEEDVESPDPVALLNLAQSCDRQNLNLALQDPSTLVTLNQFDAFQEKVRSGYLGKTAQFWMSVIDHTRLILMLQFSVRTNSLALFHKCNGDKANLFFAYDGPIYSRYLKTICFIRN